MRIGSLLGALLRIVVVPIFIVSCSSSDSDSDSASGEVGSVSFLGSITSRVTDTSFDSGDEISVTAYSSNGEIYRQGVGYIYNGELFLSSDPISISGSAQTLSYRAIYPSIELSESGEVTFEVKGDQSVGDNYALSDLIVSYISATDSTTPELIFDHYLSNITVNLSSTDIALSEATISVVLDLVVGVDYNLLTMSSTPNGASSSIKMVSDGLLSYKAIVVPQSVVAETTIGVVTVGDASFDIVTDQARTFKAGCGYSLDLTLTNGEVVFDSSPINDWSDDGDGSDSSDGDGDDGDGDDGDGGDEPSECYLSSLSSSAYPSGAEWAILDVTAEAADFDGLLGAIETVSEAGGDISLSFPNLTTLPASVFNGEGDSMAALSSFSAPMLTTLDYHVLRNCPSLRSIYLPRVTTIMNFALGEATSLVELEIASVDGLIIEQIGSYALYDTTLGGVTLTIGEANEGLVEADGVTLKVGTKSWGEFKEIVIK